MSVHRRRTHRRAHLSQHFLRKGATAARLIRSTSITDTDLVVEIGPGHGALTIPLARRAGRVIAVEIDTTLASKLRSKKLGGRVEIVDGDFLTTPLPLNRYKVVGNVPFARTTDIVRRLAEASNPPEDTWLTVQREAGHRFTGSPYVNETLWSLRLKPWWHVEIVDRLRRSDFDPPPSVESVFLWMSQRARPLLAESEGRVFMELIVGTYERGLSIRRTARRRLSNNQIRRLARDLRFEIDGQPSSLSFEQWLGIVRFIMLAGP